MSQSNASASKDWKPGSFSILKSPISRLGKGAGLISWASLVSLILFAAILYGWSVRERNYLTAEHGIGYWLGIIGGVLMLLQLAYSLRKKLGFMRQWGRVKYWFQIHMLVGVLAPVLILYHANFGLGSMNSNIALFSMLLVVFSGIIGRYIYAKIHLGLYGRRATVQDLQEVFEQQQLVMRQIFSVEPKFSDRIRETEQRILMEDATIIKQILFVSILSLRIQWHQYRLRRYVDGILDRLSSEHQWSVMKRLAKRRQAYRLVNRYLKSLRGVVEFSIYARLFALWHVLHIPLFTMLVVTAVIHVIAVHMY